MQGEVVSLGGLSLQFAEQRVWSSNDYLNRLWLLLCIQLKLFSRLVEKRKNLYRNAEGVRQTVARSFRSFIAGLLFTISIFGLINTIFRSFRCYGYCTSFLRSCFQKNRFLGLANTLPSAILLAFINTISYWFFVFALALIWLNHWCSQ